MKHLATIQSEFLKIARNWDDLSYEEQKGYLSRHPKSKRKITAKPDNQPTSQQPTSQPKLNRSRAAARKMLQKGKVISIKMSQGKVFLKLDSQGRLWTSKNPTYGWEIKEQKLPRVISVYGFNNEGAQLEPYHKQSHPTYFKSTEPVRAWITTGRSMPTNAYFGNAQIHKPEYVEKTLPAFTNIHLLPNGDWIVKDNLRKRVRFTDPAGDPGPFEKQYGFDATLRELPLSVLVRTNEAGQPIEKKKKINYQFPNVKSEQSETKAPVTKPTKTEPKTTTNEWPEDDIKNSLNDFKRLVKHSMSDEPYINEWQGQTKSIGISLRDVGDWRSRPGEEDDDYPEWQSHEKYKKIFDNWLQGKSWFDEQTMEPFIETSEKAWVEFGIKRKEGSQSVPKKDPVPTKTEKPKKDKSVKSDRFFVGKNNASVEKEWKKREKAAREHAKQNPSQGITWSSSINWHGFPQHLGYAKTKDGRIIHYTEATKADMVKVSSENNKTAYMTKEQFKEHSKKIQPFVDYWR